ncbi:unnamed protein product [Closterium sp. Yama58-4]|nr:unnamed protein product [Closterium sp. Yama58-4]
MLTCSEVHVCGLCHAARVWAVPCCTCVGCAMLHVCGLCHAARVWAVPCCSELDNNLFSGRLDSFLTPLLPVKTLKVLDIRSNLLQGRLDVFTTYFSALKSLKQAYFNFNWFSASIPSALVGITSLTSFGASYNYLYGPVPKLGTALKTIDVQKNWLSGTFPGTGFLSCSASSNCLATTGTCNTTGTTQRPLASCAVCDSPTGADPICAGGTCAPNTAAPLATSTTPTASSPILPRFCVGVPLNAAQAAILLSVKTALGVTFTEWSASTIAVAPKARTLFSDISNGSKALNRRRLAESEAGRERVLLVAPPSGQPGLCTIQGKTPVPGSWPGVFCSSAGMVVGLYLSSNLFFQRLDSFVAPILPTASIKDIAVAPTLTMTCAAVPLDANSVAAMLKVGAALGVRDTDWRNGSKCNIEGQSANPKSFPGVWCNANGTVLNIALSLPYGYHGRLLGLYINPCYALHFQHLVPPYTRSLSSSSSPTPTRSDLSYNLFSGQLSKFVSNMLPLTTMATLNLNSNYLYDSIPSALRTSGCAFCGSATGAPPFCAGTTCTPDVAARLAAGTVNTPAAALPAMFCQAVAVDDNSALVLLALRAGLGVSASSWAVDSPCTLAGNAPAVDSWTGVDCDLSGQVLSLNVQFNYLVGPITGTPSASLKSLNVASNLLTGIFPASSTTACDARSNCLADSSKCLASGSSSQRLASDCTLCGAGSSGAVICNGGVCVPDTTEPMAALTPNDASATLLPMQCSGVRIDATAGAPPVSSFCFAATSYFWDT